MNDLLAYFTLRTFFVFFSTAFSILLVMLIVNIITIDDVIKILNLSPDAAAALKTVVSRIQEVTANILHVISQLLTKLFSWAGVEVDLNKISVDTQGHGGIADGASGADAAANAADHGNPSTSTESK